MSALSALVERPNQPFVALLGGARLSDKLPLLLALLDRANVVCIGGRLCFPFLAAGAHSIGATTCSQADLSGARLAIATAARSGCRLELPHDLVLGAPSQAGRIAPRMLDGIDVPIGWSGLDIDPGRPSDTRPRLRRRRPCSGADRSAASKLRNSRAARNRWPPQLPLRQP